MTLVDVLGTNRGSCETPISVSEELCWDCNHDINGCDTCHPTD